MPGWFKTALRLSNDKSFMTDNRANLMSYATVDKKGAYAMWYGKSTTDIDSTIRATFPSGDSTSQLLATSKLYMYNHSATHLWKNNSNTVCVLETYLLIPRRDYPVYVNDGVSTNNGNTITPAATMNYVDCVRQNPSLYTTGFYEMKTTDGATNQVNPNDIDATPYMSVTLNRMFKIKRLRINGPKGRRFVTTLEPGQSASLDVNHPKPYLCNYAKFGLTTSYASSVSKTYEVLKETPILFAYIRGGVGHEKTNTTNVATTYGYCDYVCKRHWERVSVNSASRTSVQLVTPTTFANPAEEVNQYGGAQIVEEADV